MKNDEIAIEVVDCTKCPLRNDKSKCRCLNCFNKVETALNIKDKQIKEAIESVIAEVDCKSNQDMNSSTKAVYIAAMFIIKDMANLLKKKLNLED